MAGVALKDPSHLVCIGILLTGILLGAADDAIAARMALADRQCDTIGGDPSCVGEDPSLPAVASSLAEGADAFETDWNVSSSPEVLVRRELGIFPLGFVFALLIAVLLWIAATIKWAFDGTLPARLALWGLLPEAYAAISVRAVVGLLRLKSGTTPVVVLRNCVTDAGAAELAEAMRKYGKRADIQALELPRNPAFGEAGLRHLVEVALLEGSPLQEFDVSYNPQLGDSAAGVLLPLVQSKACKINTLRLADCNLTVSFLQKLASVADRSKLRLLDLSYNSFADSGETLAALCEAPVLEELMLACCALRPSDVASLAEQLPYTSIRSLQLGGNRFGNEGLWALTEHLASSQVDELGLEGNCIEVGALASLGAAWAKRPFSRVRLNGNKMSQAEVADFVRTLKSIHC